jgi:hypothetical protein
LARRDRAVRERTRVFLPVEFGDPLSRKKVAGAGKMDVDPTVWKRLDRELGPWGVEGTLGRVGMSVALSESTVFGELELVSAGGVTGDPNPRKVFRRNGGRWILVGLLKMRDEGVAERGQKKEGYRGDANLKIGHLELKAWLAHCALTLPARPGFSRCLTASR